MSYNEFDPIESNIDENYKKLAKTLHLEKSFDVGLREISVLDRRVQLYYVTGLVDSLLIAEILTQLTLLNNLEKGNPDILALIHNRIVHQQVIRVNNIKDVKLNVLSGLLAIVIDGETDALLIDVRSYPGRGPAEPDTEKTVRGSRDGYTENIIVNTALTRRRIRTGRLINEILKVGNESQTDVVLSYIEGVANENLVNEIRSRIQRIKIDSLSMTDKELEEYLTDQGYNPFPLVRYTERPDIVATHLYQGLVAIMVDTSPSVILAPITYFDHMTHLEEYRQTPAIGTFLRFVRATGIIITMLLMPTWLLLVLHPEYLPDLYSFIGPQEEGNIPLILQVLSGELGIEVLRMASIHTPNAISSALGIVSAILIGQVAIDVGLFGPEIVFYVAVGAIGNFITPSYELGLANKLMKLFIIIATYFLGIWGYIGSLVLSFIYLATMKSFGKPYLYPLIPFNFRDLMNTFIRFPNPKRTNQTENEYIRQKSAK